MDEDELRQSDPTLGHLISIGSAAHATLRASGYAFGRLVAIAHSDRDAEFGEGLDRREWFPMVLLLDVLEDSSDAGDEEMQTEVRYEVTLDFDPKKYARPGLAVLDARELSKNGRAEVDLVMLPPEKASFIDANRSGITMMMGVIIAAALVKTARLILEKMLKKLQKSSGDGESGAEGDKGTAAADAAGPAATSEGGSGATGSNIRKKKKGGGVKEE